MKAHLKAQALHSVKLEDMNGITYQLERSREELLELTIELGKDVRSVFNKDVIPTASKKTLEEYCDVVATIIAVRRHIERTFSTERIDAQMGISAAKMAAAVADMTGDKNDG